jgi:hypothetical protein
VTDDARIITRGAERMRLSRERRRQGDVIVNLEIGRGAIAHLALLGWLPTSDCDKDALTRALINLIERAIATRVTPPTGSHDQLGFMCTIQRSTIETRR